MHTSYLWNVYLRQDMAPVPLQIRRIQYQTYCRFPVFTLTRSYPAQKCLQKVDPNLYSLATIWLRLLWENEITRDVVKTAFVFPRWQHISHHTATNYRFKLLTIIQFHTAYYFPNRLKKLTDVHVNMWILSELA